MCTHFGYAPSMQRRVANNLSAVFVPPSGAVGGELHPLVNACKRTGTTI